jgi:hypothetical protein
MGLFVRLLGGALAAGAILFLIWAVRDALFTPLRLGRETRLTLTLTVTGPEPRLEETLRGLLWLRENGTLPGEIVVEDAGMDEETRRVALLAQGQDGRVRLRSGKNGEWNRNETKAPK